jgi:hypothetical protein
MKGLYKIRKKGLFEIQIGCSGNRIPFLIKDTSSLRDPNLVPHRGWEDGVRDAHHEWR